MAKKDIVDYVIRAGTLVIMAYAGWNMSKVASLEATDVVHASRIAHNQQETEQISEDVKEATGAIKDLTKVVTAMANRQRDILMFVGYRADPWSGDMQIDLQEQWFGIMEGLGFIVMQEDRPDVRGIQHKHSDKLIPPGL